MGSGNGYWTYMLRRLEQGKKKLDVVPVDSGLSEWRTMWVGDTVQADGVRWLNQHDGGKNNVLLLVYPNTGNEFTSKMIKAYCKYHFYAPARPEMLTLLDYQAAQQSSPPARRMPQASQASQTRRSPNG